MIAEAHRNRARRAVEAGEEAVPGDVELGSTEAHQVPADQGVMALEQLPPCTIADLGCLGSRADDVGEENRGQDAILLRLLPTACLPHLSHEALDLSGDRNRWLANREVARPRNPDDTCRWDPCSQVAGDLYRDNRVLGSVQDQRRNAHRRKHLPDVDLLVHPVERRQRARAGAEPEHVEEQLELLALEAAERAHSFPSLLAWAEDLQVARDLARVLLLGLPRRVRKLVPALPPRPSG